MTMPLKELVTQIDVRPASGATLATGDARSMGNLPSDTTTFLQSLTRTHSSLDQNLKRETNAHPPNSVPTTDTNRSESGIHQPSKTISQAAAGNRLSPAESDKRTPSALSDDTVQNVQTSDSSDDFPDTPIPDPEIVPTVSESSRLAPHSSLQTGVILAAPRPSENSNGDVSVEPPGSLVDALKSNVTTDTVQPQTFASEELAVPGPLEPPSTGSDTRGVSFVLAQNAMKTGLDSNMPANQQDAKAVLAELPESLKTPLIQAATGLATNVPHDELDSEPIQVPKSLIPSDSTDEPQAKEIADDAERLLSATSDMTIAAMPQDAPLVQVASAPEFHQQAAGDAMAQSAIPTEQVVNRRPFETFTAFVADSEKTSEPLQTFVAEFRRVGDSNDVSARAGTADGAASIADAASRASDNRTPETNAGDDRPSSNSINPLAASNVAEDAMVSAKNVSEDAPLDATATISRGDVPRHADRSDRTNLTEVPVNVRPSERTATDQRQPRFDSQTPSISPPVSAKPALGDRRLVSDVNPSDEPRTVTKGNELGAGMTAQTTDVSGARNAPYTKPNDLNVQQFVERAASAVRAAFHGDRQLRIRLHPPELGTLQVEVALQHGLLTAKLEVHTATAYRTLVDQVTPLHEALTQAGTPVERVEIYLAENRMGSTGTYQETGPQQEFQHQGSEQQSRTSLEQEPESGESEPDSFTYSVNMDQLDIQI